MVINESEIKYIKLPGRDLKWLVHPDSNYSNKFSLNTVLIHSGETVKPAHSHPNDEEVVYVVSGEGKVMIDNETSRISMGSVIIFPQNSIHMVKNTGDSDLKLICYFTSPVKLEDYLFYEDISFSE